ncbi:homoserine O-succinyltransferase [Streptococcus hillyeri]|uniref:Homoserine O-acetyltransferase n=1 Tax=Streptococcus hillyeri TaxID=2282420 RepID=A0A3L9DYI2_9STRE|nr:homoserine O-succinyltransferase [Streptococcus hillyeri]RLY05334.1 homoserine O-succinyltransferase [Streptococcus hillyeri]
MPITLDKKLPAVDILRSENIFIMDDKRASHQDIRPMEVLILNLMPTKEATETQLLRHLSNTPLQLNVDFIHMKSHESKNTQAEHLETFYKTFDDIKERYYDGMIITGAPVETLPFEEVDYWDELSQIFVWKETHVYSTLHLCWGAQAGLYFQYGIEKWLRKAGKLSGIFNQNVIAKTNPLMRGFDEAFVAPHSRYTEVLEEDINNIQELDILSKSDSVGLSLLASKDLRNVYSFGHLEYDRDTLAKEYSRDLLSGKEISIPENYFPDNDPNQTPTMRWNLAASTFFSNWLNYAVYQETPYRLEDLSKVVKE